MGNYYLKFLLVVITLLLPQESFAGGEIDCDELKEEISKNIASSKSCWKNSECQVINFGCPWEGSPCQYSIVSSSQGEDVEELKNLMGIWKEICISDDDKLVQQCTKYDAAAAATECSKDVPPLICLNGKCVTQTHVLIKGDEDGKDPYGSREILK